MTVASYNIFKVPKFDTSSCLLIYTFFERRSLDREQA